MTARLYLVVAVLAVGMIFVTVVAVRQYHFRQVRNWQKLGETLRRARIKQLPFLSPTTPRQDSDFSVPADRPDSPSSRGSQTDRPSDGAP